MTTKTTAKKKQKKAKKPNNGGRPPINKGEKRVPFSLSVSEKVKAEIIRVAEGRGCPPGDFVETLLWYYQGREGTD